MIPLVDCQREVHITVVLYTIRIIKENVDRIKLLQIKNDKFK
jgi:hypothetical protein